MVLQVSWYYIPISIIIFIIILGIILYIIVKIYLNKWKKELSLNMNSLCKIYDIPNIDVNFIPTIFNKQSALSFLMLNFSVSSWSGCQTSLPEFMDFKIIKTFKGYDSKAKLDRDIDALYYSKNLHMAISGTMYISEWGNDFDFTQINPYEINKDSKILVHKHDYEMYNSLRNSFIIALNDIKDDGLYFISTGHSLGGALSTICFFDIVSNNLIPSGNRVLYSFASPRVGNDVFASIINNEYTSFRISNSEDIITTLPLPISGKTKYEHINNCISFSENLNDYVLNHIDAYINILS